MANRWKHRNTPHNLVSDFSVRIMGSSSSATLTRRWGHRLSCWPCL
ncbi:TPA: hypothetical protein JAJ60_001792 [Corynebacterium striatum]|nr:hypothetical protein [Corynebacterium striatum]HAT6400389.1 hypothetical protein [Corynebacterium striatum]HAT6408645.1 hypothetical protein [Corynebacterium striatum]HAT6411309.1 hypothetical protein [Corynebacterium striatum]HAT6413930.1 hypothetical protein [Corynebacterium striatum]